jgi:hypothetical protein
MSSSQLPFIIEQTVLEYAYFHTSCYTDHGYIHIETSMEIWYLDGLIWMRNPVWSSSSRFDYISVTSFEKVMIPKLGSGCIILCEYLVAGVYFI